MKTLPGYVGPAALGVKMGIIVPGSDLVGEIATRSEELNRDGLLHDGDVVCVTESVVARSQNNIVSVDQIAAEVKAKLGLKDTSTLGVVHPIASRNRFSVILRALARAVPRGKVVVQFSYPYDEVGNQVIDPAYKGIYLRLSTTALFCGLFAWSTIKNTFFRLAVLLVMIPLLFFMGSRADFVTFLVILPVALWLTLKPAAQLMVYLFGGIFLTGAVATVGLDALKASRHFEIFNVEQFGSLLARNEMFLWGMERVANSPLFGDYGGTLAARGTIGSYIHNFLSVWQAFGLLPFLLFLTLMVLVVSVAIALLFKKGRHLDRQAQLLVVLGLLVTIEILVAKSVGWSHVALAWGFTAGWFAQQSK